MDLELMVMDQFFNVAEKEIVQLLREKRFKSLKDVATLADDHVLFHRPVSRWTSGVSSTARDGLPEGAVSACSV